MCSPVKSNISRKMIGRTRNEKDNSLKKYNDLQMLNVTKYELNCKTNSFINNSFFFLTNDFQ